MMDSIVTAVITTHNRCADLKTLIARLQAIPEVGEIVVVADGCTDETNVLVRSMVTSGHIRAQINPRALGPEVARNQGIRAAGCEWVAILDDDDLIPSDFFARTLEVAQRSGAGLVSVPWLHLSQSDDPEASARNTERVSRWKDDTGSTFPAEEWAETIWINSNFIVTREHAQRAKFDEGLRGNYWRDETGFAVTVARNGGKVVVTNVSYSYYRTKDARVGGIRHGSRLRYEFWVLRNESRFLRRHGRWLAERGFIRSPLQMFSLTLCRRIAVLTRDTLRALSKRRSWRETV